MSRSRTELPLALLAAVSRSFYLSLRVLPGPLRFPLGLGYLLARATDTVADAEGIPEERRSALLDGLARRIAGEAGMALPSWLADCGASVPHAGERELLGRVPELLELLDASEAADRDDLREVLAAITRGQQLDLARGRNGFTLETEEDLVEYADLVAGAVGVFWTRVSLRHLPGCARAPAAELEDWGLRFGRGLQLVNILRDFPVDLARGRCYLPGAELRAAGIDPARLATEPQGARVVFEAWCARALQELACGSRYAEALRPARLRFAVLVPWMLGEQTLARVRERFPERGVKVTRTEVRRVLVRAAWESLRF